MRKTDLPRLFLLIVMAAMVLGCGIVLTDPPTPTPVPMASPTITPIPPTETPIPTDTPAPTATPAPTQSISTIVEALRAAAEGRGVSDAATYDPKKSGVHPIIIFSASKEIVDEWNAELPDAWRGQSVSLTELVATVTYTQVTLERKQYFASGVNVWVSSIRIDTEVILREAKTGRTVSSIVFKGGDPRSLPNHFSSRPPAAFYGTSVAYETVELWLKEFVEK